MIQEGYYHSICWSKLRVCLFGSFSFVLCFVLSFEMGLMGVFQNQSYSILFSFDSNWGQLSIVTIFMPFFFKFCLHTFYLFDHMGYFCNNFLRLALWFNSWMFVFRTIFSSEILSLIDTNGQANLFVSSWEHLGGIFWCWQLNLNSFCQYHSPRFTTSRRRFNFLYPAFSLGLCFLLLLAGAFLVSAYLSPFIEK